MKKKIILLAQLAIATFAKAQLNGTYTIPGSYPSLAAAINDLNLNGVSGPVTFNITAGYIETAPMGGYVITATGTASNPIVFQKSGTGNNPLITAYTGGSGTPSSASQDGVFTIVGGDYLTFDGIDIVDPNTTNPATMEYGFGFFKASATNGCQYNVIMNCKITLSYINNASGSGPSYEGSKGIMFINAIYGTATSSVTVTAASGAHAYNSIVNNTIMNVNYGVVFNGYSDSAPYSLADNNNSISNNTIKNFGGATGATNPAAGIRVNNQYDLVVSGNVLRNNDGSGANHPTTLRGIFVQGSPNANITISNNTLKILSGATTSTVTIIELATTTVTGPSNNLTIQSNVIDSCGHASGTSGAFYGIYVNSGNHNIINVTGNTISNVFSGNTGSTNLIYIIGTHGNINCLNNNLGNSTIASSGIFYAIYCSNNTPNINVLQNNIQNITKLNGGSFYGYYNFGSPSGGTFNFKNNLINNINLSSTSAFYGIYQATTTSQNFNIDSNTVSNVTSGSGTFYGFYINYGNTVNVSYNTFTNISASQTTSIFYGIYIGSVAGNSLSCFKNSLMTLTTTGNKLYGIYTLSGTSNNFYANKITSLNSTSTSSSVLVAGFYHSGGNNTLYNNIVGALNAPSANNDVAIAGIYAASGTVNAYFNTVYLNASSTGTDFGSTAMYASTTAQVLLQNNIFINNSTANGIGYTVAYRRSGTSLSSYNTASNNNIFYAGTPSSTNLIFYDGTNAYQTLSAYKAAVSPADNNSFTENTQFLNTTNPASANYLHVDGSVASLTESNAITVSTIGVDYDGDIRQGFPGYVGTGTAPDIGADEYNGIFAGAPNDLGVSQIVSPATSGCYSSSENVIVTVKNYGTNPQSNFTVQVNVTGTITQTLTATYNNTLNPGMSDNVSMGVINMSAPGPYNLKAFTTLAGDANNSNDTITGTFNVIAPAPLPQQVDFTGFNGTNLSTVFPLWKEAQGVTPNGTTSLWTSQTNVGSPGNVTARVNLYTNTRKEWIVGPKFVPTSSTVLKFDAAVTDWNSTSAPDVMGSDDKLRVMVSTDCGITFSPIFDITKSNNLPPTLTPFTVSLGAYANQEIIVAFFATDGTVDDPEDYDLHIDNINIYNAPNIDIQLTSVISPASNLSCFGNETVKVIVTNNGSQPASNFTVGAILSGAATGTLSFNYTNTLAAFASDTVTLGTFNMSLPGTYTITSYVNITGDAVSTNDTLAVNYNHNVLPFPYLETFDLVSPLPGLPAGWQADNTGLDFAVRTSGASIHHGAGNPPTQGLCANLWSSNSSSWFVTPPIGPLPSNNVELGFLYRIVNYSGYANPGGNKTPYAGTNDSINIFVSTNCGTTWTMVGSINGSNHVDTNAFRMFSICLGDMYAGQNIRLRFEAKRTTGDYWIDIDSLQLYSTPAVSITPSTNFAVCQNQPLSVTANMPGAVSYQWTPGNINTPVFNVNTSNPGNYVYTVQATKANGCFSKDSISVIVNALPSLTVSSNSPVCEGDGIMLNASTNATNVMWTGPQGFSSNMSSPAIGNANVNMSGYYVVTVTDSNNCQSKDSVMVTVKPAPDVTTTVNNNTITVSQTGATYQWINCNTLTPITGATAQSYTPVASGQYAVVVTLNGCTDTSACVTITLPSGIADLTNENYWSIAPNPNNGNFVLKAKEGDVFHIMDMSGKLIEFIVMHQGVKEIHINVPQGVYFIKEVNGYRVEKLIIHE